MPLAFRTTRLAAAFVTSAGALSATLAAAPSISHEKTLRIARYAADIPRTLGQPDQGFEGNRFTGIPM